MSFDGGCSLRRGYSEFLSCIGIVADDLRCLSDEDFKRLVFRRCKEMVSRYKKGDAERKEIIDAYKAFISDEGFRGPHSREIMSEILAISEEYLKKGFTIRSMSFDVIDIFKERYCFDSLAERNSPCPKVIFSFDENGELSIIDGRITKKVSDRKVVGCVRYGTRPYSNLESMVKKAAISYQESWYMSHYGRRRRENVLRYDREKAKNLPLDSFPSGIEQYIYPGIEEHSILLSLKGDNIIVPEGKIEGIYLK